MSSSDSSSDGYVEYKGQWGKWWDMKKEIDLEGGKELIYEGEEALYEGAYGVIFPCKLRLGGEDDYKVIDAVVKCEKKECNSVDGHEMHKWKKIPPHKNLVKFYGGKILETGDSQHFGALLVFEKMDCNLEELMFKDKPFAEKCTYGDLIKILLQIVRGLLHLHKSGFLHMDLKPQNILVSEGSRGDLLVKIADFGESKALKDTKHSMTATFRGTQAYMAPELLTVPQFMGNRNRITSHADVYSLGIVMYSLFNKEKPPFTSQDHGAVGREINIGHFQSYKVFCQAPLELCHLIEKCLCFEISNLHDSRKHGRPSFNEILSVLEEIKKCEWLSQKIQTKVAEHYTSAAMKDHAGINVNGASTVPRNGCVENVDESGGVGTSGVSEEAEEEANDINSAAERSSGECEEILFEASEDTIVTGSVVGVGDPHPTAANGPARNSKISFKGKSINVTNSAVGIGARHHPGANGPAKTSKISFKAGKSINVTNSAVGIGARHHPGANGPAKTSKISFKAGKSINMTKSAVGIGGIPHRGAKAPTQSAKILLNAGPSPR